MAKCRKSKREQARQKESEITHLNEKHNKKICQWWGGAVSLDQRVHLTSEADCDFTKEAERSRRVFLRPYCVLFL